MRKILSLFLALLCSLPLASAAPAAYPAPSEAEQIKTASLLPDEKESSELLPETKEEPFPLIDAPFIDQRKDWPNGCEAVSAVMALCYAGAPRSVSTFVDYYLPKNYDFQWLGGRLYGPDPALVFPGDPATDQAFGCYASVILTALEAMEDDRFTAKETTGETLPDLCREYIDRKIPVLVWGSINMEPFTDGITWFIRGTNRKLTWKRGFHCLLLVGYDEDYYYFNDPMVGKNTPYPKEICEERYEELGRMSLVIEKNDG